MRRDRQPGLRSGKNLDRRAFDRAGKFVFRTAVGQIFEAGNEQRRILAVHDRERTALPAIPIFPGDDRAVAAAMIELHRDSVGAVDLDAVDRSVDPAGIGIAHDDKRTRANERAAVMAVPDRRRQQRQVHVRASRGIFHESRRRDGNRRLCAQVLALFHPGLECVERPQRRIEPQGQRGALHIGRRIGEYAKAAPMALDIVEQEGGTFRQAGCDFRDAADFELRVGAYDAPQHAELVDECNEFAQVLIHVSVFIHASGLYTGKKCPYMQSCSRYALARQSQVIIFASEYV